MEFRTIGKSGIKVSAMSLGTWAIGGGLWWGDNDDAESIRTIHAALDGGINWVDTASVWIRTQRICGRKGNQRQTPRCDFVYKMCTAVV